MRTRHHAREPERAYFVTSTVVQWLPVFTTYKAEGTRRELVDGRAAARCEILVTALEYFRAKHKTESIHQLWQEGFHPQAIVSDEMMVQKREYLHQNPVKRGLVSAPEHWRYSSAHEWCESAMPLLRCDPWR